MVMVNARAMQVHADKGTKKYLYPVGVKPKYLAMGSWHANLSKGGVRK